jgi:hypothetical protein
VLPPEYARDVGAKAILHAAACLPRDVYVGGASQAMPGFARRAPSLCDRNMSLIGVSSQTTRKSPSKRDGLTQAAGGLRERSRRPGRVLETGAYTRFALQRHRSFVFVMASGAAWVMAAMSKRSRTGSGPRHSDFARKAYSADV